MGQRLKDLFLSPLPDMAQRLPSAKFREVLADILRHEDLDVVEVEGIELAQYLFQTAESRGDRRRPLLVFDDHNAEYVLQQRAFETDVRQPGRWIGAAYSFVQWRRLRRYERAACQAADRVVAVSGTDAEAIKNLVPGLEPAIVPNGVDMAYYGATVEPLEGDSGPREADLAFTAKMDFRPNVDAVLWFAREVLPLIRMQAPETCLWAVGRDPHSRLASLGTDSAVALTGWVEDVRPYIAGAGVYIVPLRMGGGTRLKVLEAMAMGKAIVSTSVGCEGFEVTSGRELVIADSPPAFAAAVLDLLQNRARRDELGAAARAFAWKYDWPLIVPQLEALYEES
jgi:glycosyltransferase involved in cell wall biosynthesis